MDGTGIEWGGEGARRFYRFSAFLPEAEEPREIPPGMTEIEVRTLANYGLLQSQAAVPSGADRCDGPTVFHADGWFECHGAGCLSDIGAHWHASRDGATLSCSDWREPAELFWHCPRCTSR